MVCLAPRARGDSVRPRRVGGGRKLHRSGGPKLHTVQAWQLYERSWSCPCTAGSDGCYCVTIWSRV